MTSTSDYGPDYYAHGLGPKYLPGESHWEEFFGTIAHRLVAVYHPSTALDAGCAMGILVGSLRESDVAAVGIDLSDYAVANCDPRALGHVRVADLSEPLKSQFDLITCIEVLEHIPAGQVESVIANLCSGTDEIVFSSTPFDFNEATHINVRQPDYWLGLFADQGFARRFDIDASFISPWAVAVQRRPMSTRQVVVEYEAALWEADREIAGTRAALLARERAGGQSLVDDLRAELLETKTRALVAEQTLQATRVQLDSLRNPRARTQPGRLERTLRRVAKRLHWLRRFLPR